jgi:hypothetical protein
MKNIAKISLSLLIVSIMLIGLAWAEESDSSKDESFEEEYYFPEYGANAFDSLKNDLNVIETRGTVPEITEDKEKMEWLDTIKECINNSESELHPYMKEFGGPLVGFGTNYGGYLFVDFDEDLEKEINDSAIDKFYNIIDTNAKKAGISDIPVVFRLGGKEVQDSRTTQRADMIGGIKIGHFNTSSNTAMKSTLSFAAIDPSSGTTGFVMSGHAAISAGGVFGILFSYSIT